MPAPMTRNSVPGRGAECPSPILSLVSYKLRGGLWYLNAKSYVLNNSYPRRLLCGMWACWQRRRPRAGGCGSVFHGLIKSIVHSQQEGEDVPAQVVTGLGSADVWKDHGLPQPFYFSNPRFDALAMSTAGARGDGQHRSGTTATGTASLSWQLTSVSSMEQADQIVTEALVRRTAEILQMPTTEVDPAQPLYHYGVDSLTAIEVRNWISRELKANVALLEIVSSVPIREFAAKIAEKSQLISITA